MVQVEQMAQMIEQKGQQLAEIEEQMQAKATDLESDQTKVDASIKELTAQKQVVAAEFKVQKANLELFGRTLVDNIEDITDPIVQQLAQQTKESETEEGEETEDEGPNPQILELIGAIEAMNTTAKAEMAQMLSEAMVTVGQIVSAPRETILKTDASGEPIGSTSRPIMQ